MTRHRPTVLLLAGWLFAAAPAIAQTTLHVNAATGHDAVTRAANSAATPWRTIGRAAWGSTNRAEPNAAEAARAGDVVVIAAGTYDFSGSVRNRWGIVYNPVNEGTGADKAITFRAAGPVSLTAAAAASPVIGCFERDYVIWQGPFALSEASISIHPDTGPVAMAGGVRGCGVDGISVDGDGAPDYDDNHTGVRIEGCTSCFVRNSTITNVRHYRGNHNGSGVMLYDSYDTQIERNHIYAVDNAVFVKGARGNAPQSGTIIRFNLFANCNECVTVSYSRDARVYQNIIRDSEIGLNLHANDQSAFGHPVGDWFVNNTVYNMAAACVFLGGGPWQERVRVWNNIFSGCRRAIYREGAPFGNADAVSWEHNVYNRIASFSDDGSGRYGLRQWQQELAHDLAKPSSVETDPRFADAAAGDFRLCRGAGLPAPSCRASSSVLAIGIDVLDLDGDGDTTDTVAAGAVVTGTETFGGQRPESAKQK